MPAECRVCKPEPYKPVTRPDGAIAHLAANQWGVLSLTELLQRGLSRPAVTTRVKAGHLHPIHRDVYAVGHPNLSLEGRFVAAVKACGPTAVLSHFSAAALYGLVRWLSRSDGAGGAASPRDQSPPLLDARTPGHHAAQGHPGHHPRARTHRPRGHLRLPRPQTHVREAQRHLVTICQIVETRDRLGPRRGTANLTRILATGHAATRSELEDAVLDLLLKAGFKRPDVNRPLTIQGRTIVPDFRWPEQRLIIEADGAEWHDDRLTREDDAEKQALLEAHGERVIRVTWAQAVTHHAQTIQRILAAGAPT